MVGVLYGTMTAEHRSALSQHLTESMAPLLGGKEIPLQVNWPKIHGSTESAPSVYATTIQIKRYDYATVSEKLYGNDTANKDWS